MNKQTLYLYLRCSTDTQIEKSIKRQKDMGVKFFEEMKDEYGFSNYKVVEDGGKSRFWGMDKRENLSELFDGVDMGYVKHLWVEDWSRLSGEIEDVIRIETKVIEGNLSIYEGMFGNRKYKVDDTMVRMFTYMKTMMGSEVKKDEVRKSINSKKRLFLDGCYMKGDPPFGYKLVDRKLVVRKDESKWVKKIFDWYGNHKYSYSQIRKELQMNDVKRRRTKSNKWNDINIITILENENYIGKDYYTDKSKDLHFKDVKKYPFENKKVWEKLTNECPSIVDEEIFHKVKKLRSKNKSRPTKREYFLHSKLICNCGCEWVGRWYHKYDKPYYHCLNNERRYYRNTPNREHLHKSNCNTPQRIDGILLDNYVWNNFLNTMRNSKWLKEKVKKELLGEKYGISSHRKSINSNIKRLTKEIETFEKNKIQFIKDRYIQNLNSMDYEEVIDGIDSQIRLRDSERQTELNKEKLLDKRKDWIDWLGYHNDTVDDWESVSDMKQRRRIIDYYVDEIELGWNHTTKQHSIHIRYKYPLVGGELIRKGNKLNWDKWGNGYKLKEGEQIVSLSSSNFFLSKENYQTSLNGYGLRFDSSVPFLVYEFYSKTHRLSSTNYNKPLSNHRTKLHKEIFKLKDEGLGYRKIHKMLVKDGWKIGKSPTTVDSIIRKRNLRDTILNQPIVEEYQNFDIQFVDFVNTEKP